MFADTDLEGIIWLVIIAVWVAAQMFNAARSAQKKKNAPVGPRKPPAPAGGGSGGYGEDAPPPPPASLPDFLESIREHQRTRQMRPNKGKKAVPAQSKHQKLKPIPRKPRRPAAPMLADEACHYAVKERSDYVLTTGMESFKLTAIRLPNVQSSFSLTKIRNKSRINLNLRNDANFRRAVISRTVLGPPKSIAGDDYLNRD